MDKIQEQISQKLEELAKMIQKKANGQEIEEKRKELDKLLEKYLKDLK